MDDDKHQQWFAQHEDWRKYADLVVMPPNSQEIVEEFPDSAGSSIVRDAETFTTFGVTRGALYLRLRMEGQSHRFAEMIACQQPPGCGITDDVFFGGVPRLADQMTPNQLKTLVANARRHGFNPPADCMYQSGLARFPGDPEAFVTRSMGRSYIKSLCEKRGWACEGGVTVEAREPLSDPHAPEKCVPLAADLVRENACRLAQKDPSLTRLTKSELRNRVLQKFGPSS